MLGCIVDQVLVSGYDWVLQGLVVGKTEGQRELARLVRVTVARYCLLAYILAIRNQSERIRNKVGKQLSGGCAAQSSMQNYDWKFFCQ